jgi:hypothetical protein
MRRISFVLAAVAALTFAGGCSAQQAATTAETFKNAKAGNRSASATSMAASALAAQSALYHIASSLSDGASKEADKKAFRIAQAAGQPVYTVDMAAGTGKIELMRGTQKALDLSFKFEKQDRDGGMLYKVSALRGTTEGFQVLLPELLLAYTVATDDQGNALKTAQGGTVFQVSARSSGFLGVNDQPAFQIAELAINVQYPIPTGETRLGSANQFSPDGQSFQGEAYLNGQAVSAKGQVLDALGTKLYDLAVGGDAKVTLTPAAAPAPAAPAS